MPCKKLVISIVSDLNAIRHVRSSRSFAQFERVRKRKAEVHRKHFNDGVSVVSHNFYCCSVQALRPIYTACTYSEPTAVWKSVWCV